jgi:mono/diheme cytochrome c family protein
MQTKIIASCALVGLFLIGASFTFQPKPWTVPAGDAAKANPNKSAADATAGKALYAKHCESCHGKTGLGDGKKAAELKTEPGDFTKDLNSQTDGALFYKIGAGRDDMPKFKGKMDDEERWQVVTYVRSFKK